ncbi:zinc-dependent peptidase [Aquimarina agarilytica]|uniref:zinc-dependent peptidase n=1 Tax=Aquimarina agarilytica TaxID=1087449 RepID=UPI000287AE27|nr:zinc-dependent peptidase [Aquimarina agarilytica]
MLSEYNTYYSDLALVYQKRFRIKTLYFLNTIDFDSDRNFKVDKSMKILISSAFAQITFGLHKSRLDVFELINVTPAPYSYSHSDLIFNGDTNFATKTINLCWPVVKLGFEISDDALNLAIHEFEHAIMLEDSRKNLLIGKALHVKAFDIWKHYALIKLDKIRAKKNVVLRDYGGTNIMELFSVCLEAFFENSDIFHEKETDLYNSMVTLLKQDPRNKQNPLL